MKLLIVDDSAMIRRAINNVYEGTVFTDIQTASDGLLAVTVFKQQLPDVVTLDITMPHMDGLAALTQMLELKPNTIVLVISALADHHTAIESLIRGARQFICKPFTEEDLKNALDSILGNTAPKPQKKRSMMESDTALQSSISKLVNTCSITEKQQVPEEADYPSGYVSPPRVETPSRPNKKTDAVTRQISLKQIREQMESEKKF